MSFLNKSKTLATGLAMFSMFFGAGNIVFPLVVGQQMQDQTLSAILGLLITAICVPFAGVIAMVLYDGQPQRFFGRIGRIPGILVAACILALIGPFGGMPRCVTLAYSTLSSHVPWLSLPAYSLIATVIIFLCSYRKNRILPVLGYILTPILLLCLSGMGISGLLMDGVPEATNVGGWESFVFGLQEGYNTMDLLAAFFFSGVVLTGLKQQQSDTSPKDLFMQALKASVIGASLLSLIYVVFSIVAAKLGPELASIPTDKLLGVVSARVLGPYTSLIAGLAISLTCLTTAIALACVFAEALQKQLFGGRITYLQALMLTLIINTATSMLEFTVIVELLAPLLQLIYPGLIILTIVNIAWKLLPQQILTQQVSSPH